MQTTTLPFTKMPLIQPIQDALKATGYVQPTPIQEQVIPLILNQHDVLGIAQTGTGKTAAFCLPIIQLLYKTAFKPKPCTPRALILAPTRELALQIQENLETYSRFSKLTSTVIFGGVGQGNQVKALQSGIDILVATTGRLLDLVRQGFVKLDKIEIFVLDEADRMLDMGFYPDILKILEMIPKKRQNLFFSATMPHEVTTLARKILHEPHRVEITPAARTAEKVEQFVAYLDRERKLDFLMHVLKDNSLYKVILFVEMKHVANRITEKLTAVGIPAAAIHSDKSQGARQRALDEFKTDKLRVLVATDIAARGIDVDGITHVINYDLSHLTESYVHRIGRTARAGAAGKALTLCTSEEKSFLFAIEKETRAKIHLWPDNPFHSVAAETAPVIGVGKAKAALEAKRIANKQANRKGGSGRRHGGGGGGGSSARASSSNEGRKSGGTSSAGGRSGGGHSSGGGKSKASYAAKKSFRGKSNSRRG